MKPAILYEVYPKRALMDLVIMDRCWNKKKAIASARSWGALVIRIEAEILRKYPLTRRVISSKIIFVHNPARKAGHDRERVTRKHVMGKLKKVYKHFRR
jgi:hypothetical protein